jgi:hypothetical protein
MFLRNTVSSAPGAGGISSIGLLVSSVTSRAFRLDFSLLSESRQRLARVSAARQAAMYLCHVGFGLGSSAIAQSFRRDPATVRHGLARIEDRRDAKSFDRAMAAMEVATRALATTLGLVAETFASRHSFRAGRA